MSYRILLERPVRKALDRLPDSAAERLLERIGALADDPRPVGCIKLVGSVRDWRIRVGAYRILYQIDEQSAAITILRIGHRKDVYRV